MRPAGPGRCSTTQVGRASTARCGPPMSSVADPRPAPAKGRWPHARERDEVRRPPRSSPPPGPPPGRPGRNRGRPAVAKTAAGDNSGQQAGIGQCFERTERLSSGVRPHRSTTRHDRWWTWSANLARPGRRTRSPADRGGAPVAAPRVRKPSWHHPEGIQSEDIGESGSRRSRSLRQQQPSRAGDRGHQQPHGQKRCAPPTCASEGTRRPARRRAPVVAGCIAQPVGPPGPSSVGGPGHGGPRRWARQPKSRSAPTSPNVRSQPRRSRMRAASIRAPVTGTASTSARRSNWPGRPSHQAGPARCGQIGWRRCRHCAGGEDP